MRASPSSLVRRVDGRVLAVVGLFGFLLFVDLNIFNTRPVGLMLSATAVVITSLALLGTYLGHRERGVPMTGVVLLVCLISVDVSKTVEDTILQRSPGLAETFGLLLLLCMTFRYLRRWQIAVSSLALLAAVLFLGRRLPDIGSWPIVEELSTFLALLTVPAVVCGLYLRSEDRRRVSAEQRVRQAERLDLARDLHDHVAHYVTAIIVQAQAGEQVVEGDPATGRELFANIERTGQEGLVAMSRMVRLLRSAGEEPEVPAQHTLDTIRALVARFSRPEQPVRLHVGEQVDIDSWSQQLGKTVERLVQEGLTNVGKHARSATGVLVNVEQDGDRLLVRVRDDGTRGGLSRFRPSGFGMIGLSERVSALGGELTSGPLPDRGWVLTASIPTG
ncbi:sensor histidine kinase [Allokutzneria oryzae]|uniref:histidine kinase n=1 Tax=Allokutzneria oryzae TaxID=1378989 RepID=A0ABV5ZXY3_9PSEU